MLFCGIIHSGYNQAVLLGPTHGQYVPLMMQENKQITKVRELFPKNNNHVITQSGSMIISPKKITGW